MTASAVALVVAVVVAGCSGDDGSSLDSGGSVVLRAQHSVGTTTLRDAARVIDRRLATVGRDDATVTARTGDLVVNATPPVDPAMLQVLARRGEFAFRAVESELGCDRAVATLAPSARGVLRGAPPDHGCYDVGPELLDRSSIVNARASRNPDEGGSGWGIDVTFRGDDFVKRIAEPYVNRSVAMVLDGVVLSAPFVNPGITARIARISGNLDESTARAIAAALRVKGTLPVGFVAPAPPARASTTTSASAAAPRVNEDHWHAALGVNVCGRWLRNVPAFDRRAGTNIPAGLHSHGDGLVHVHPYTSDEAGEYATLGQFLREGGWSASATALHLWDGATHTNGDACARGEGVVRFTVNGKEGTGDPSTIRMHDGDVIALAFVPKGARIGLPPQASAKPSDVEPG